MNDPLTLTQTLFLILFLGLSVIGFLKKELMVFTVVGAFGLTLFSLTLGGGLETAFLAVFGATVGIIGGLEI